MATEDDKEFSKGLVDEQVAATEPVEEPDDDELDLDDEEAEDRIEQTAEDAEEPKVAEKPKAADPVPERKPATLIRSARQLGISEAKIASLSADALDMLCDTLAEKHEQEVRQAAEKSKTEEPDEDEATLAELKEELDPKVFKLLEGTLKRTKSAEAALAAGRQSADQQRMAAMVAAVDTAFTELDSPLLGGKAVGAAMGHETAEMERRNLIIRSAFEKPVQGLSLPQAIKHYAKLILGVTASEAPTAEDKAVEEKKKKWKAGGTAVPSARTGTPEKGDAAAIKAVGRWLKENGIEDDE